jgi:hypothetical protein
MTSVRDAIWNVAAAYAPFTAHAQAGVAGLFGSDAAPDPPPAYLACPWFYLELLPSVESAAGDPNWLDSGFRWWGYDLPQAGYVRLRAALGTLAKAPGYGTTRAETDGSLYSDSTTGEIVVWQQPVGFGSETGDQERGLLVLTYQWSTRMSMRGDWP